MILNYRTEKKNVIKTIRIKGIALELSSVPGYAEITLENNNLRLIRKDKIDYIDAR